MAERRGEGAVRFTASEDQGGVWWLLCWDGSGLDLTEMLKDDGGLGMGRGMDTGTSPGLWIPKSPERGERTEGGETTPKLNTHPPSL